MCNGPGEVIRQNFTASPLTSKEPVCRTPRRTILAVAQIATLDPHRDLHHLVGGILLRQHVLVAALRCCHRIHGVRSQVRGDGLPKAVDEGPVVQTSVPVPADVLEEGPDLVVVASTAAGGLDTSAPAPTWNSIVFSFREHACKLLCPKMAKDTKHTRV